MDTMITMYFTHIFLIIAKTRPARKKSRVHYVSCTNFLSFLRVLILIVYSFCKVVTEKMFLFKEILED